MKPIFFLVYPLLAASIPFIGPPKAPTPFRLEHRSTGVDWNTPRPDSFLKKRSGLHSVEFFTNPPATRRRSPQPMGMSPVSPLQPLEERATSGQWMDMEATEPGSGAPAVTSWGGQRQDVFYMGRNTRSCYYKYMAPGQSPPWSPWVNLGGSMDSSPSCCSRRPNYMHLYCKGTDGQCWHRPYNGGSWGGWQGMGGNCKGYPSSCSWGPRHSAVYVSSNDNQCWGRKYDENTGWGNWENMGGSLNGPPKAVTWGEGNTGVVVRGQDGQAWVRMMNNGNTWGNWQGLGGSLDAEPAASAMNGRMDVFVTGTDGAVWTRTMMNSTGTWGNWMSMGGDVKPGTPPDVVAWSSGGSMQMEVYYTGPSSQVYRKKYQNGQWSTSWENMGGSVATKPNVVGWDSGKVDVYGMGSDGGTKRCY